VLQLQVRTIWKSERIRRLNFARQVPIRRRDIALRYAAGPERKLPSRLSDVSESAN